MFWLGGCHNFFRSCKRHLCCTPLLSHKCKRDILVRKGQMFTSDLGQRSTTSRFVVDEPVAAANNGCLHFRAKTVVR
jgi:hypothetical protein